jgi:predicted nucleic acid-binding protein
MTARCCETSLIGVPDIFHAEFAQVLWKQVRARRMTPEEAFEIVDRAFNVNLTITRAASLLRAALLLAVDRDHPVCDTLFVALAAKNGVKLVTFDGGLLAKFPEHAIHGRIYAKLLRDRGRDA